MSSEKVNQIVKKAGKWAESQSTEKLEKTLKNLEKINSFTSFDEELQIKWTIKVIYNTLDGRMREEVRETAQEILDLFKTNKT
jgi:hypothetical protein